MQTVTPTLRRPPRRVGLAARAQRGMTFRDRRWRGSRGMTLIEIMVVVAIISLIMGGVGIMAFNRYQDAQKSDAKTQAIQIQQAIAQYKLTKKKCPKSLQELKAAGFISRVSKDPWGGDYQFTCPGEKTDFDVVSAGEDQEFGTPDDIANYDDESAAEEDK